MEISTGDPDTFTAASAAYQRCVEWLASNHIVYGLPAAPQACNEEQRELVIEAMGGAEEAPVFAPPTDRVLGKLTFELDAAAAPRTVENVRALCTGERGHAKSVRTAALHYKGCKFHRVLEDLIQGGDVTRGDGSGGESIYGSPIKTEAKALQKKHDKPGTLGMASNGRTSTSQFYITLRATPDLDGKQMVLGYAIDGDAVLAGIQAEMDAARAASRAPWIEVSDCGQV